MKKLNTNLIATKLSKAVPFATIAITACQPIFCDVDLFTGLGNIGSYIAKGVIGLLSVGAFVAILFNVISLIFHSSDDKIVQQKKNAVITIFKWYAIALLASFLLTTVASIIGNAFNGADIIATKRIDSQGNLK